MVGAGSWIVKVDLGGSMLMTLPVTGVCAIATTAETDKTTPAFNNIVALSMDDPEVKKPDRGLQIGRAHV